MKGERRSRVHPLALLAALALAAPASLAQSEVERPGPGGGYRGPGDTVPQPTPLQPGGPAAPANPGPADGVPPPPTGLTPEIPGAGGVGAPPGFPDPSDPPAPETPEARPVVTNPNSWQIWWHYNRWEHLEVGGLSRLFASTGTEGFFLGRGEKVQASPILRATRNQIVERVQPTLKQVLAAGGSAELEIQALHALAKLRLLAGEDELRDFTTAARALLQSGNQEVVEKAVLALGVHGDPSFLTWLAALVQDAPLGHELLDRPRVGVRARVFAAYALGLLGERNTDLRLRREIQVELSFLLLDERPEVQAAAILAMGLAPLPDESELTADVEVPGTRVDQVLALLGFYEDERQDPGARSQVPYSLARLLHDAPDSLRARAAHSLLLSVGPHSSEPAEIQGAAVQALGRIGRSGEEPIDAEIRSELERIAYHSSVDGLTRYLAMVSMAQAASRKGSGEQPFAGLAPARKVLLRQLLRNRGQTLCWTALALGILEEHAADRGEAPESEAAEALRLLLHKSRGAEVGGAIAIALGLMRDHESKDLLLERLADTGEDHMRGYVSLALGMIGARAALEPLRSVCEGSLAQPFTLHQSAIALALLGDQESGWRLFELLLQASDPSAQASIAAAMGWSKDPRTLPGLCERLLARETNDTARKWAAVALGRICDTDEVPWVGRLSVGVQYDVDLPTLVEPRFLSGLLDMP